MAHHTDQNGNTETKNMTALPEELANVELVGTHARAAEILTTLCEYDAGAAGAEADSLVGYWYDVYNDDAPATPTGELRLMNNCASHSAVSLIGGRFYPHYDANVWVDEAGLFWADQNLFC